MVREDLTLKGSDRTRCSVVRNKKNEQTKRKKNEKKRHERNHFDRVRLPIIPIS